MSDNICGTERLHVNAYIKVSGMVLLPPMILPPECGEPPKDLSEAEIYYSISSDEGTVHLVGGEGVLVTIAILRDALHRESALNGILKPSREQLEELREAVDKVACLAFVQGKKI